METKIGLKSRRNEGLANRDDGLTRSDGGLPEEDGANPHGDGGVEVHPEDSKEEASVESRSTGGRIWGPASGCKARRKAREMDLG
jgi:hypothetical protein